MSVLEKLKERQLLEDFMIAKETLKIATAAKTIAETTVQKTQARLIEHLTDYEKESTAKYDGLGHATLGKPTLYANYLKQKEPEVFQYFRDQKLESIIKETIHKGTLSSYVTSQIEAGLEFPEFITYYLKPNLRVYPKGKGT